MNYYNNKEFANIKEAIREIKTNSPSYILRELKADVCNATNRLILLSGISESLKDNKPFFMELVKLDGEYLMFASQNLKADEELVWEAIHSNLGAYFFAHQSFKEKFPFNDEGALQSFLRVPALLRAIDTRTLH